MRGNSVLPPSEARLLLPREKRITLLPAVRGGESSSFEPSSSLNRERLVLGREECAEAIFRDSASMLCLVAARWLRYAVSRFGVCSAYE